jgi:SAM-dependent methyltransferase
LKVLDLGCGDNKAVGSIGIDHKTFKGVDVIWDLNILPYPYKSNSIDKIIMDDILEHLEKPLDVLEECYRILKKEGILKIKTVYWNHKYSSSDFTHLHSFSEITFKCLVGKGRPLNLSFQFSEMKIDFIFSKEAIQKYGNNPDILFMKSLFHCGVIQGMNITLTK